jgi:hypothetical protein
MKKNVCKLKLHFESLRILDGMHVSAALSGAATCTPSCPATCGANPATTTAAQLVTTATFTKNGACCV